ncbi:Protein MON2 [Mycena kentingensis (nom. inval.)]|nr:Protein MON2 [Mycena kentingensis (nom. inval.)]
MSSLAFLVTELQSLASETRRKHPDIREAADKSLAILRASPEQATANLASDGPQSEELLKPVFMGLGLRANAKVVALSLGSLQRLIALKAVPQSAVERIVNTMGDAMSQGVDIQLRILQTLLSLITNFPAVHGELLGQALLLCFRLQESKIAVVSSTAAATLRQLVMFVFDKMVDEDRRDDADTYEMRLPNGTTKSLGPSARDAFSVFEDLCLLANSEKPNFLKLDFLHKTFALELIESVLTNYHALFRARTHSELTLLLQLHLCPLLLKALSDRPSFPLTLRCTRVVFLLLKQFSAELETEAEIFLMLLIKIIGDEPGAGAEHEPRPTWMRVIAMEIMRGLCSDAELVRNVWARYDAKQAGSNVFSALITALKRLVTEKPALLGVSTQIFGIGVQPEGGAGGYEGVAGMVANAASATVSGVVGMIGGTGGLSLQGSAMKLQCIDQLDKADAPPIPDSYIYLLGVQCIVSLCEGFAAYTTPVYSAIVLQRPRAAGESVIRAPPSLDLASLPASEPATTQLRTLSALIESGWPALLAALSFIIATNVSDELFVEVLASYQAMTNVAGMLGLTTPRDAFFTSLAKFAVPTRVVSSLDATAPTDLQTPRSATLTENLGLTSAPPPVQPPGLSERNMACLKVLVASALFLAGSLGESWFGILEALQNADYVLTSRGNAKRSSTAPSGTAGTRHTFLTDLDTESLLGAMQRLFDATKNLADDAFRDFVRALCKLSAEMVGMQTEEEVQLVDATESGESVEEPQSAVSLTTTPHRLSEAHRRRVSGIHLPRTLRTGDFGIAKLGGVALLNIHRLIYRSPEIAWNTTTSHLLSTICSSIVPQPIRIQAARVLDDILVVVPRNLSNTSDLQADVQRRVLTVLKQQVVTDYAISMTGVELRRMGLETLHQILEASGHTLVVGWETIFEMLASVCKPAPLPRSRSADSISLLSSAPSSSPAARTKPLPLGLGTPNEKGLAALVKIAFQSLTLVCDSVSSLSPEHLRLCIATLGQFGRQSDTNIALTAAASLLWSMSDAIQSKRKNADAEREYNALWMFLLLEVLGLCTDARPEVRDGAIQTLFRTMQLYGATLSQETWDDCLWKVAFPLLEELTREIRRLAYTAPPRYETSLASTTAPAPLGAAVPPEQAWDDSKTLALQSIGSLFHDFLASKIITLDSFVKAWGVFVDHIQDTVLLDNRSISPPALRCLEKAVKAASTAGAERKEKVGAVWERVWGMADQVGDAILRRGKALSPVSESPHKPFTQDSLVAFLDVVRCTRSTSRALDGVEWPLERLTRLMAILKARPTIAPTSTNSLPSNLSSSTPSRTSTSPPAALHPLIISDLAEYATLAFLAAFDAPANPRTGTPQRRVTYIALCKKVMPTLVSLFLEFRERVEIYADGTLESLLSAYAIPVKLKYDCAPSSKFAKDVPPLWKTATASFLRIVKECVGPMERMGGEIPDERVEGIWRQLLDVFRGGILADCSAVESFPLEKQEEEENFDLALIGALEIDVVPYLGNPRVPDQLAAQLAKILQQGSRVYARELGSPSSADFEKVDCEYGSSESGSLVPRERFSYWCFDLLFLVCSDTTKDQEPGRRRLAALSLPSLLSRCRATLVGYVADASLRGTLPFPRARDDEVVYVLRKLLALRLWDGSLFAAFSDDPTRFAPAQALPPLDVSETRTPGDVIKNAVKRSRVSHLFHFYGVLCEIASVPSPRRTPTMWVKDEGGADGEATELDARTLARECLKVIGTEMGV